MDERLDHSLQELAAASGVNPRTIRDYVQKGLLRGADSRGPKARYGRGDLMRLRLIRRLREGPGLGLDAIRKILTNASSAEIATLAISEGDLDGGVLARLAGGGASRALEYLDGVRDRFGAGDRRCLDAQALSLSTSSPSVSRQALELGGDETLNALHRTANALDKITTPGGSPRRSRPALWVTLPVTPDLELRARVDGALDSRIQEYQRIAEQIRELLLGGGAPPEEEDR